MAAFRPSFLTLPKLEVPPASALAYLSAAFPHLPPSAWTSRLARGLVTVGPLFTKELQAGTPYQAGLRIRYFREVVDEPPLPFDAPILFQDEHLLVVDKPPFMPVTPSGPWVQRSLLYRLEAATGIEDLAPLHRLDRETSGLVLFSVKQESRAAYNRLFQEAKVEKTYEAMARLPGLLQHSDWTIENRLEREEGSLRMRVAEGSPNSFTHIQLVGTQEGFGRFAIRPRTGKKHQIRVHMHGLGFPIFGDRIYPRLLAADELDFSNPLRLLAKSLVFLDPLSGETRAFATPQSLAWP